MLNRPKSSDDPTEVVFCTPGPTTQPPSVDPAVLRRALKYGQKARAQFAALSFRDAEVDLRAGWEKKGETTEWEWVRAAVRAGFEQDSPEDE
jgi:hypothetical protein